MFSSLNDRKEAISCLIKLSLAFDLQSHSGTCSLTFKHVLLFSLGKEGTKLLTIAFSISCQKEHPPLFFFCFAFIVDFWLSQGCSHDLRNKLVTKIQPLKTFKGKYPLLQRHRCNWVVSKDVAEVDLPKRSELFEIWPGRKTMSFHGPAKNHVKVAVY